MIAQDKGWGVEDRDDKCQEQENLRDKKKIHDCLGQGMGEQRTEMIAKGYGDFLSEVMMKMF